jgi:mannose-1-phosphate guanylyltransferase
VEKETARKQKKIPQDRLFDGDNEATCALVLAGGEGRRLQPFIKSLGRGSLPKQYVNFIGTQSMLQHTWQRAQKLIPPARIFTVTTEAHLRHPEVREQFLERDANTIIVQPENRETGPGLLLPLLHLYKRYPNSVVLTLPSDHFVSEEDRLMRDAHLACVAVKEDPSQLVLLGVKPDREEPEYGYVLPRKKFGPNQAELSEISLFVEKPDFKTARRLIQAGGLWNTMIMAFHIRTMLHWVDRFAPGLYQKLQPLYQMIGTRDEARLARDIYQRLQPVNFSKEVLEPLVKHCPSNLIVLRVRDVLWSDWGTGSRVMEVLRETGKIGRLNRFANAVERKIRRPEPCQLDHPTLQPSFVPRNGYATGGAQIDGSK